jgi:hypothetical protein
MTSPMAVRGHYTWLHPWLLKLEKTESLEHRTHSEDWNQFSIWSKTTAWIIKMGLKLTMPISNFKAGNFSMSTWFFDANYPLRINSTSVVRKRKLGTQEKILKNRIPLSTIISRFRHATKRRQIFNIAGNFGGQMSSPVCSRVVGPAPKKMCYRAW